MIFWLSILLVALLAVVVYQDFKSRAMSWFLIPILFVLAAFKAFHQLQLSDIINYMLINLSILVINLLGVALLVSIKEKKFTNIIDTYLGLGDILFFVVLSVVFSPFNFILFYLGSISILTLVYGSITLLRKKQILVPLAGAMSLMLMVVLITEQATTIFNCYNDLLVLGE